MQPHWRQERLQIAAVRVLLIILVTLNAFREVGAQPSLNELLSLVLWQAWVDGHQMKGQGPQLGLWKRSTSSVPTRIEQGLPLLACLLGISILWSMAGCQTPLWGRPCSTANQHTPFGGMRLQLEQLELLQCPLTFPQHPLHHPMLTSEQLLRLVVHRPQQLWALSPPCLSLGPWCWWLGRWWSVLQSALLARDFKIQYPQ